MHICIVEHTENSSLHPLDHLRPIYDLRCGIFSLQEKLVRILKPQSVSYLVRPHLLPLMSVEQQLRRESPGKADGIWFINARTVADSGLLTAIRKAGDRETALVNEEGFVAAYVRLQRLKKGTKGRTGARQYAIDVPEVNIGTRTVRYPWELMHHTAEEIERDARLLKSGSRFNAHVHKGAHLLSKHRIWSGKGTTIMPGAVLDAGKGPIILGARVTVMPLAYIEGPCAIGDNSVVKTGAKIYHGTSIGPHCKIGGEIEASVIQGYSNKQHEGFLGHSYLGSWVNLGADTNTSDLKNTYGPVRTFPDGKPVDTGMQFVGLTMGDHSKTGINVMFDTGTIVGTSCNIYGASLPPKFVPSFLWGTGNSYEEYELAKSLETARRMMSRRGINMSPAYEAAMKHVFTETRSSRSSFRH
jgi:UDP-N-acetylglucosamine diphosphorylase/glucosamine-1-phosphate N-acetyltransferase